MNPAVEKAATCYTNSEVVQYVGYWEHLTARNDEELFKRFLFAFMSVHTTWETNVRGYEAIRDFGAERWPTSDLRGRIYRSGAGLHNNRAKWIVEFAAQYWADPASFRRGSREPWAGYRDRIERRITGLGKAKTSFTLELAFPLEAQVLCLDVHMLRLYGKKDQNLRKNEYERYEADWVGRAQAAELPPYIIKQIYWDKKQSQIDSRYWSKVFE